MTFGRRPIPAALRRRVYELDGWDCVAPRLGAEDACLDLFGEPLNPAVSGQLTLDHVKDQPMLGKRAPDDEDHLVTLCWHHHLNGWATAHRPDLRRWIVSRLIAIAAEAQERFGDDELERWTEEHRR